MSNSAIYFANTSQPTLQADATIPFGSVIRRFGPNLRLDGNDVMLCGTGYYKCACDLTFEPAAIGPVTIQILLDGQPIPGAVATQYAASANNPVSLSVSSPIVRIKGCDSAKVLSAQVSAAGVATNFAGSIEKL